MPEPLLDRIGRPLRDLRVSVTDRCNFRCTYCMPKEVFGKDHAFLPRSQILTFEEITRVAGIFAGLGVEKLRLTGGEPLLRKHLEKLIALLTGVHGLQDITLTTNGSLLEQKARSLFEAGLRRITVSLDALDPRTFAAMNDMEFPVERVLQGIQAAADAGFAPIKINMVVRRGVNEADLLPMARRFQEPPFVLRFIEYMDVGNTNGWRLADVVSGNEILDRIGAELPLVPLAPNYPGEVARRFRHRDSGGEIGVITSVTQPFCRHCTRARLAADGGLYPCLFANRGLDLRAPLRAGLGDREIAKLIRSFWSAREDRYSEVRSEATRDLPKPEMSVLGG
jgi:cyclic pyranopterin phosphate synthase